ncbi:pseudouridine synthase [Paracoccus seriniphilus]|uniref:Pseudouridine synthase n=1 Tax=Paracoccus seriniphilus TaxID=184748 RepID=A0A239PPF0_9RHOB|nr:pseudouridine synthase [Paracoccus seriniphilus]WCR14820.1 pseudouridine synthase [Paracoccus seriniphilus]SNT71766.1 23S rRNA pseudouridine2605 synthase [Paracoccus seriniphilus]
MTETPENPQKPANADRIAKVMARAGVASRREAERMILEGRVSVNGKKIASPALDVLPSDVVVVDGKKLDEKQETRLWLYYKPNGLVTSESDEKGRQTIFDALPRDLPRVMTIGRLDLNSEGLLLLTNDGELKRRLELPATGWLRRYRVRVNGTPNDLTFDPLRRGVTIDGEDFAPMEIRLDSQQGANAWVTVGIREGRNREIRRAMAHVGLQVNRLIRIGYGPFKLVGLEKNQVSEVKRRVLRDQLGGLLTGDMTEKDREMRPHGAESGRRPERRGESGGARPFRKDDGAERPRRFAGNRKADDGAFGKRGDRGFRADDGGENRRGGGAKPFGKTFGANRPRREDDGAGDRPRRSFSDRPGEKRDGKPGGKPFGKPAGGRPAFAGKPGFKGPRGERDGAGEGRSGGFSRAGGGEGRKGGFSRDGGGKPAGRFGGKPGGKPQGKPRGPRS